jgi:hypothetical protein
LNKKLRNVRIWRLCRYFILIILLSALAQGLSAQSRSGVTRGVLHGTPAPGYGIGGGAVPSPKPIRPVPAAPQPSNSTRAFIWILLVVGVAYGYRFALAIQTRNDSTVMSTPIKAAEMLSDADRDRLRSKANGIFWFFVIFSAISLGFFEFFIADRVGDFSFVLLIWLLPMSMAVSIAMIALRIERDLRAGRVAIAEGLARVEWVRAGRSGKVPVLRIQGVTLGLSRSLAEEFRHTQERRVYYAPKSRILLRTELLIRTNPNFNRTVQLSAPMDIQLAMNSPQYKKHEIWIIVILFAVAGGLGLISQELGTFGVIGVLVAITSYFGYPAFSRSKPISVVPNDKEEIRRR